MKVVTTISKLQAYLQDNAKNKVINFVPTMGNLHAGHLSLVTQAKKNRSFVVVSIYVNRKQFNKKDDFFDYPRTYQQDHGKLEKMGVDLLFYPDEHEIYPEGIEKTTLVVENSLTKVLCGVTRLGHFEGVTTVVNKFLNIIQPDSLFLGEKDYQQYLVIKKMVDDLFIPCQVEVIPTSRETSKLAMSSRNNLLSKQDFKKAAELYRTLTWIKDTLLEKDHSIGDILNKAKQYLTKKGFEIDYLDCLKNKDLSPLNEKDDIRQSRIFIAVFLGKIRLIDNIRVI